jgi:hypothetical protein
MTVSLVQSAFPHGSHESGDLELIEEFVGFVHDVMTNATCVGEDNWVFGFVE